MLFTLLGCCNVFAQSGKTYVGKFTDAMCSDAACGSGCRYTFVDEKGEEMYFHSIDQSLNIELLIIADEGYPVPNPKYLEKTFELSFVEMKMPCMMETMVEITEYKISSMTQK